MKIMCVSPSGDDITGTGSFEAPYRTIERAILLFADGDQIRLLEGTFTPVDSIIITHMTGSIFADYPGSAIIQPSALSSSSACIAIINSDRFTIKGIEVKQDSGGVATVGIMAYNVQNFICQTCSVDGFDVASGNTYGILGYGTGRIENCHVYDMDSLGENMYGIWTDNMHIIDCEVYSLSGAGSVTGIEVSSSQVPYKK